MAYKFDKPWLIKSGMIFAKILSDRVYCLMYNAIMIDIASRIVDL